jgi:hypothetical protein
LDSDALWKVAPRFQTVKAKHGVGVCVVGREDPRAGNGGTARVEVIVRGLSMSPDMSNRRDKCVKLPRREVATSGRVVEANIVLRLGDRRPVEARGRSYSHAVGTATTAGSIASAGHEIRGCRMGPSEERTCESKPFARGVGAGEEKPASVKRRVGDGESCQFRDAMPS